MEDTKKIYRRTYYEKNKGNLIEYGKKHYNDRNTPTVIITITHFVLYFG